MPHNESDLSATMYTRHLFCQEYGWLSDDEQHVSHFSGSELCDSSILVLITKRQYRLRIMIRSLYCLLSYDLAYLLQTPGLNIQEVWTAEAIAKMKRTTPDICLYSRTRMCQWGCSLTSGFTPKISSYEKESSK